MLQSQYVLVYNIMIGKMILTMSQRLSSLYWSLQKLQVVKEGSNSQPSHLWSQ